MSEKIKEFYGFATNYHLARRIIDNPGNNEMNSFGVTEEDVENALMSDDAVLYIEKILEKDDDVYDEHQERGKRFLNQRTVYNDKSIDETQFDSRGLVTRTTTKNINGEFHCETGPAVIFPFNTHLNKYFINGKELTVEEFEEQRMLREIPINNIPNKKPISF